MKQNWIDMVITELLTEHFEKKQRLLAFALLDPAWHSKSKQAIYWFPRRKGYIARKSHGVAYWKTFKLTRQRICGEILSRKVGSYGVSLKLRGEFNWRMIGIRKPNYKWAYQKILDYRHLRGRGHAGGQQGVPSTGAACQLTGRLQAKAKEKKPASSWAEYLIVRIRQANMRHELNTACYQIWYFWILRRSATLK